MSLSSPETSSITLSSSDVDLFSQGEGVIVAHHGVAVEVRFNSGARCMVRVKRRSGHVVGDAVRVSGEVLERLPRRTELCRRDAMGADHLVGANLDLLGIVVSSSPLPPAGFIDQAIVAARAANLLPFIVVNKCDLDNSSSFAAELSITYSRTVQLFVLSAITGEGLSPLTDFFAAGHRGAFVGTSGVGKSSLLNALCPEIALQVGELNDRTGKGRQTTTVSTLHSLDAGGELIDTPGFQDFGLIGITAQELSLYFPGFELSRTVSCRFRNCRHRSEPGCAVIALVEQSQIPAERYANYLEILGVVEAGVETDRCRSWKK